MFILRHCASGAGIGAVSLGQQAGSYCIRMRGGEAAAKHKWIPQWIGLKISNVFFLEPKMKFCVSTLPFLQPNLHYRSTFQSALNIFKFGVHLVHRILKPMVKR